MMEEVCGKDGVLHDGVLATLIPVVILEGALGAIVGVEFLELLEFPVFLVPALDDVLLEVGLEVLVGSLQKLIFQL